MDVTSKKVLEIIKRNGEFDKYRKEVFDKIVESDEMKKSIEKCHFLVEAAMDEFKKRNTSPTPADITILRQSVKERMKRERVIQPLQVCCRQHLDTYDQTFGDLVEGITRNEMGLPPKDLTNTESVDMEVSSGSSPSISVSSSSSPSSSSSNFEGDEQLDNNSDSKMFSPSSTLIKEEESSLDGSSELSDSPPPEKETKKAEQIDD